LHLQAFSDRESGFFHSLTLILHDVKFCLPFEAYDQGK